MHAKHRRGPWTTAEDQYLLELVQTQGAANWVRISGLIGTRSPKQCRERYHQNLKPSLNLDPITPEEGVLIERMVAEMGKRWAEIARRLHNRSDNAVKNWWNGGMNRRKRLENRRSEYVPRQSTQQQQHQHQQQPQPQQQQAVMQQQQPLPQVHHQMQAPPQHHMQAYAAPPQPQPMAHVSSYDFYPQPPQQAAHLAPSMMPYGQPQYVNHAARRLMEQSAPIPSPSGFSSYSRAESAEGAAPSLVSDMSYNSYSHPSTPRQSNELGASSYHHRQISGHASSYGSYPAPEMDFKQQAYPLLAEQWPRHSSSPNVKVPFGGQLPLPAFNTMSGPGGSPLGSSTSPKDSRMKLSNLMS